MTARQSPQGNQGDTAHSDLVPRHCCRPDFTSSNGGRRGPERTTCVPLSPKASARLLIAAATEPPDDLSPRGHPEKEAPPWSALRLAGTEVNPEKLKDEAAGRKWRVSGRRRV